MNVGNCSSLSVVIHLDVMKEEKTLADKVDVCLQIRSRHTFAGGAQPLHPEGAVVQAELSSPQPGFARRPQHAGRLFALPALGLVGRC